MTVFVVKNISSSHY